MIYKDIEKIVLWDPLWIMVLPYSELPNPSWYEYKDKEKEDDI